MEHLLLAPTFVKRAESDVPLQLQVLHKGVLRSVYSAIKTCSHLYIVGYRFPMTDYEFYLAFRSAVRTNESLRRIVVVNKPKPPSEMVQFVVHFQSLLERTGKEDLLEFDFGGVEEWVKKPLLL